MTRFTSSSPKKNKKSDNRQKPEGRPGKNTDTRYRSHADSDEKPRNSNHRSYKSDNSSRSRSDDKPFARGGKPQSKPTSGSRSGQSRQGGKPGAGSARGKQQQRRIVTFDPSLFIKKAVATKPEQPYIPKNTFNDFAIDERIKKNIAHRGYTLPTRVQDEAIPYILQGRDIVASANTGTGKTAAFLIPLVHNVLTGKTNRALIIVPTRELAVQIEDELKLFKLNTQLKAAVCIGGANIETQIKKLASQPEFVIGTPGRLMDLEDRRAISFGSFDAIVLDEVDRMLDMGFINDVKKIIADLPRKRHSLFFSATMPQSAQPIMDSFLNNPVKVAVKTRESAENVNQDVIRVGSSNKIELLHDLLIKPEFKKVIIFARTKRATDKLGKQLTERGFQVSVIHGDRSQAQRQKALDLLKAGKVKILLATDVVARGIDIDDVTHVINYDLPQTYEDYIHRIGRTGRADKAGNAITFVEELKK